MKSSLSLICALPLLTSGCAIPAILDRTMPADTMDGVHLYSHDEARASNLIDKALAACPEQTETFETRCVKEALSRATMGLRAMVAMIPECRLGSICTYDHRTRRRLGFFSAYATVVVKDWRVSFDLRNAPTDVASIPVTVTDRNVFIVPPSVKPKVPPPVTPPAWSDPPRPSPAAGPTPPVPANGAGAAVRNDL